MKSSSQNFTKITLEDFPNLKKNKIGIVVSEWNKDITSNLLAGAQEKLIEFGIKNENIKINDVDFQELENKLINEFTLPYSDQTQTPTQLLNNFTKTIYKFEKVITPQDLGVEAHEQIMVWGVLKAQNYND